MKGLAFKLYRLAICHSGRFRIGPSGSFKKKGGASFFSLKEKKSLVSFEKTKNESFAS